MNEETRRLIANLIQIGTVTQTEGATARVQIGELETDFLSVMKARAGKKRHYCMPSVGEQVIVLGMCGDLAQGLIVGSINSNAYPALSTDANIDITEYDDGTRIEYNQNTKDCTIHCAGTLNLHCDGAVTLTAPSTTIESDMTINGELSVSKTITSKIDVIAGPLGISLIKHIQPLDMQKMQALAPIPGG